MQGLTWLIGKFDGLRYVWEQEQGAGGGALESVHIPTEVILFAMSFRYVAWQVGSRRSDRYLPAIPYYVEVHHLTLLSSHLLPAANTTAHLDFLSLRQATLLDISCRLLTEKFRETATPNGTPIQSLLLRSSDCSLTARVLCSCTTLLMWQTSRLGRGNLNTPLPTVSLSREKISPYVHHSNHRCDDVPTTTQPTRLVED